MQMNNVSDLLAIGHPAGIGVGVKLDSTGTCVA